MALQCPFCRQTDLADDALRCPHCGSWLDPDKQSDAFAAFSRDLRGEVERGLERQQQTLAADLDKHRAHIEKLLGRMQIFAGVIAAVAGGFAIYFTGITKENISQTTARIEQDASKQVQNAATAASLKAIAQADETVRQRVGEAIAERLASPEAQGLIERAIAESVSASVRHEVDRRLEGIQAEIDTRSAAARRELDAATAQIDAVKSAAADAVETARALQASTTAALAGVNQIESNFANARNLDLANDASVIDFQTISGSDKGGLDQLSDLAEARINALTFTLGSHDYWAPVAWKYLDTLDAVPQFEWVVLLAPDGVQALGYWPARQLAAALNPPENDEIAARLGNDPFAIPDDQEMPEWVRFTDMIGAGDLDGLSRIPGYRTITESAATDWTNFQALDRMLQLGVDQLPVLDDNGALIGFADRSRLTTQMLLEIATRLE
ncbi:hypothetical protein [Tropicimonas sp. IMCC34043]|uniref:hypothetical protein n=1 Tax=Tropicimonas sp. IMCC34043 TaxID=2248760 RepID=UPI000E27B451|nr:hypothetical protein [Tropicimonas sp. IMCC34043]